MSNAVKFTREGKVRVDARRDGDALVLSVADTGPGIAPEDRSRVFEPFRQLGEPRQKHASGVGLGLALVREVTHALGGSIALEGRDGAGAIFTIRLPPVTMHGRGGLT